PDAPARRARAHCTHRLLDVHAAAGGMRVDVTLDVPDAYGAAGRLRAHLAADVADVDGAARGVEVRRAAAVAQLDAAACRAPPDRAAHVAEVERAARGLHVHLTVGCVDRNGAPRRVQIQLEAARHLDVEAHPVVAPVAVRRQVARHAHGRAFGAEVDLQLLRPGRQALDADLDGVGVVRAHIDRADVAVDLELAVRGHIEGVLDDIGSRRAG